jgi:hypothetical protein
MPTTPRDAPYIEQFLPSPKDQWMTGLRVETAKQNRIDFYSKKATDTNKLKKYLKDNKPSSA